MIIMKRILAMFAIAFSCSAYSQEVDTYNTPARVQAKELLIPSHEIGLYVDSLPKLVQVADIIVQGRYGRRIGNEPFFGYGVDKEDMERRFEGRAMPRTAAAGLPMSEYEILVDNIIKGEQLVSSKLVLRILESPDAYLDPPLIEERDGNHLFFFMLNPDMTTVGLFGALADLKEEGDTYTLQFRPDMSITALDSHKKEEFLDEVVRLSQESEK